LIKTIPGYQIEPGVSEEEYEDWLLAVRAPDILANPLADKLVFNEVLRPAATRKAGAPWRASQSSATARPLFISPP
jgi:hypothetical protein